VADYKLFCLDASNVLQAGETFAAATQREAIALARARLETFHKVELWAGSVRVWTGSRKDTPPGD
jgi:hypothetical protein